MFSDDVHKLVESLSITLKEQNLMLATAESCTGGLIASAITERPGSSAVFERGFVTYSNQSKQDMLSVCAETLETYGAVSSQTAEEMAVGALKNSKANLAVSVTGIAGPDGGSEEKPVGSVYIGLANANRSRSIKKRLEGNRTTIRNKTLILALNELIKFIN